MKELIYFFENHSINIALIIDDVSPWVFLIMLFLFSVLFQVVKDTNDEAKTLRENLRVSEAKSEQLAADNFSLSFKNDGLSSENSTLIQRVKTLEKQLEKYNFPRDSKGHFISKKTSEKSLIG